MKNVKRALRMLSVLTLALVLVCGTCLTAFAAPGTASLDFSEKGSITLTLYSDEAEAAVTDGALTLYEVAELYLDDGNMAYAYTENFSGCGASLADVTAPSLADTLAEYADSYGVPGIQTAQVGSDGTVRFGGLTLGLYLVIQTTRSEGYYTVDPFLVTVPMAGESGWIYNVNASPKTEIYPEGSVPEEGVPETPAPEEPETPETSASGTTVSTTLPQTGQLNWPIPVLAVCGILMLAAGCYLTGTGRRRTHAA